MIRIKLFLRNVSKQRLYLLKADEEQLYSMTVTNSSGRVVPRTEYGKKLLWGSYFSRTSISIEAGQMLAEGPITINRIFEMSSPDTYSIVFKRPVYKADGKTSGKVTSNTIKIRVPIKQ